MSNGREANGQFAKGGPGGPGRPKKGDPLMEALKAVGDQPPEKMHYDVVQRSLIHLGIEDHDMPTFDTIRELQAWAMTMQALAGDEKARAALIDRESPKPQRVAIDAKVDGPTRAPMGSLGETDEANEYVEMLDDPEGKRVLQ